MALDTSEGLPSIGVDANLEMTRLEVVTSENVLNSLRLWHGGEVPQWPLAQLRLGLQIAQQEEAYSSLAEAGASAQNRAFLSLGLATLRKVAPEAEELLRARFEHQRDVLAVANSLNISEPSVYYRQRQAINQLTEILIQLEEDAGAGWRDRMLARLELQSYTELVGIEKSSALLIES